MNPLIRHYIELVWYKAYADLRVEASRGYLGILWWVLEPILYMVVFYIIFGLVFQRGGEGYVAFLLVGLVVWRWFDNTIRLGANSLLNSAGLMQQVYVPKIVFPSVAVVTNTAKFGIVLLLLLLFLLIYGASPLMTWIALPALLMVQLVFIISLAWFVSAIVPFLPDLRVIIDSGLTLLFFMSGIFFDIGALPVNVADNLRINPMAILIESYRNILIEGIWPDWSLLGLVAVFGVILIVISFRLHARFDLHYAKIGLM